jgi:K+-transporting ATPase ATPase C chain
MRTLVVAIRAAIVTAVLTGVAYPLAVTGVARLLFPKEAEGSLARGEGGHVIGSELLAQGFAAPWYFRPRPSAAGAGYDAANSGASNLGPTSRALRDRTVTWTAQILAENPEAPTRLVPVELVTCSASGLDPHISPEAAHWQAPRVARARDGTEGWKATLARIDALIDSMVEGRTFGFLGEPRVNVLLLNQALDRELGRVRPTAH